MQHNMNLCKAPFEMILSGQKTYELRLYDEKRQKIQIGDTIIFTSLENGKTFTANVVSINVFESFAELYSSIPMNKCGYSTDDIPNPDDMLEYYSKEQQNRYKAVAIEIQKKI